MRCEPAICLRAISIIVISISLKQESFKNIAPQIRSLPYAKLVFPAFVCSACGAKVTWQSYCLRLGTQKNPQHVTTIASVIRTCLVKKS